MINHLTRSKEGITHIAKDKRNIRILWCVLVLIIAWATWCIFFLPAGADVTDEGFYCSEAWRLSQGDMPFVDSGAAFGLSFWFLSGVFYISPDCGLLGLRIVWAICMLLCALAMAGILLRYFDPRLSFAASGVSLFFVAGGAIKVLCYNQMPVLGLLIAVWLWLAACESGGRKQVLLAAGAGIAACTATLCRISLLPVFFLPILTVIYDSLCGFRPAGWMKATIAFMAAFTAGLACFFFTLYIFDLLSYFTASLDVMTGITGHSLIDIVMNFIYSFLFLLLPALILAIMIMLKNYKTIVAALRKNRKFSIGILIMLAALCLVLFFFGFDSIYQVSSRLFGDIYRLLANFLDRVIRLGFFGDIYGLLTTLFSRAMWTYSYILIVIAFSIVFAAAIWHIFNVRQKEKINIEHLVCRLGVLALFMSILMILGTANYPASYSVRAISWLPISVAFCLSWNWIERQTVNISNKGCRWLIRSPLILAALIYVFCGIVASCFPYMDAYIGNLYSRPISIKLQGITTTEERAEILDSLVAAVERNSSRGDRILAYENLPMLYFLTNRLPSTNTTWISSFLPGTIKQSILNDMIVRDRLPKMVIRAEYLTWDPRWPVVKDPLKWDDADPIDKYIREHYCIIDEIDGFQIMLPVD